MFLILSHNCSVPARIFTEATAFANYAVVFSMHSCRVTLLYDMSVTLGHLIEAVLKVEDPMM